MLIFKLLSNANDSGKWTPITWYISDKYLSSSNFWGQQDIKTFQDYADWMYKGRFINQKILANDFIWQDSLVDKNEE